jgi:hypothetical protein
MRKKTNKGEDKRTGPLAFSGKRRERNGDSLILVAVVVSFQGCTGDGSLCATWSLTYSGREFYKSTRSFTALAFKRYERERERESFSYISCDFSLFLRS